MVLTFIVAILDETGLIKKKYWSSSSSSSNKWSGR
jgi:hypothetical protein